MRKGSSPSPIPLGIRITRGRSRSCESGNERFFLERRIVWCRRKRRSLWTLRLWFERAGGRWGQRGIERLLATARDENIAAVAIDSGGGFRVDSVSQIKDLCVYTKKKKKKKNLTDNYRFEERKNKGVLLDGEI